MADDDPFKVLVISMLLSIQSKVTGGWISTLFLMAAIFGYLAVAALYMHNALAKRDSDDGSRTR
jgi:hypothetical protein